MLGLTLLKYETKEVLHIMVDDMVCSLHSRQRGSTHPDPKNKQNNS